MIQSPLITKMNIYFQMIEGEVLANLVNIKYCSMYNQRVIDVCQLPIPIEERKCTDVICTWLHSLTILVLLGFAIFAATHNTPKTQTQSCPQAYQQLWSEANADVIMCVEVCPNGFESIDGICFPSQQKLIDNYLSLSPFKKQWNQSNLKIIGKFMTIFVFSLSLAILTLSYFASRIFQRFLIVFSILILVYLALILIGVVSCPHLLNQFIARINMLSKSISLIIIGVLILLSFGWITCFNQELTWNGLVLDYASKILPQNITFIIFIFKYYLVAVIAFGIFVFQSFAFTQSSNLFFGWTVQPSFSPLQILNIFQLFWNLQSIKDTLYFSLANQATFYYYSRPIAFCQNISLNCLHGGSVSGGSLVSTIFFIPNCMMDAFFCFPQQKRQNCGLCCTSLTGIARSDAYAYQSLTGIPYCNSSRQCRRLSNESKLWSGVNSPLSNFKFFLHIFTNGICIFFGVILMDKYHVQVDCWRVFTIFIVCQYIMSGLIDILIIMSESLQTCLLADASISNENQPIYQKSKLCEGNLRDLLRDKKLMDTFQ